MSARVAVVGVGSIGAMALWQLAERGIRAEGFDTYSPGHGLGAAGGESRIYRAVYREGGQYLPLLRRARQMWEELDARSGVRLFRRTGFATVGPEDHDTIRLLRRTAEADRLDLEPLRGKQASERLPEHPLRDGEIALFDPLGGTIRPEASVLTAAELAERSGAVLHRYTKVEDVRRDGDHCVVVVDGDERQFDQVIVAPGPWTPDLACLSGLPVTVRRICAAWFPRTSRELFDPSTRPAAIRVGTPAYSCFPAFDDIGVKVIHHVDFQTVGTGETTRPSLAEIQATTEAVRQTLPGLRPVPIRTEVYRDSWTPDGHAILGRLDDGPILVATGFSGHGFKLAPAFGSALADLVQGRDVDATVASLSPARFIGSRRQQ